MLPPWSPVWQIKVPGSSAVHRVLFIIVQRYISEHTISTIIHEIVRRDTSKLFVMCPSNVSKVLDSGRTPTVVFTARARNGEIECFLAD